MVGVGGLNVGLARRLLLAAARAHYQGAMPPSGDALADAAGVAAPGRAVDRALARLAEDGLIEGVVTADGWYQIRLTARGLRRAGAPERVLRATANSVSGHPPAHRSTSAVQTDAPATDGGTRSLPLLLRRSVLGQRRAATTATLPAAASAPPADRPLADAPPLLVLLPALPAPHKTSECAPTLPDGAETSPEPAGPRDSLNPFGTLRPRATAVRAHLAQAWHVLTTFP